MQRYQAKRMNAKVFDASRREDDHRRVAVARLPAAGRREAARSARWTYGCAVAMPSWRPRQVALRISSDVRGAASATAGAAEQEGFMRIAFLVNRDIESNLALNLLLPEIHQSTVGIFLSERVGASAVPPRMLGQLAFVEQDLFNRLVFPLMEQTSHGDGRFAGFGELERRFGTPVQALASLNDQAALQRLRDARADLVISIRFGLILGKEALGLAPRGILNLHSGLLPRYRGVLATFRALLNGDAQIGCTLHWIDSPAIDAGPIVETARTAVAKERSLLWHILSLYRPGTRLILNAIRRLESGEPVNGTPQDPSAGAYYSFPTQDDLTRFTALGWRLFDREDVWELLESYGCKSTAPKS
ncbi:formyl transferase [Caldimonas sp. KR1-144]|uniref:formyl transferase n=1 Tax=Caldimonas sp. KR1-144 TaxID=3400911 RepID=UPI003C0F4A66